MKKRLSFIFVAVCVLAGLYGCDNDEDKSWIESADTFTAQVVANGYEIPAEGEVFDLRFNSGDRCEMETAGGFPYWEYCDITEERSGNETLFHFQVKPNEWYGTKDMPIRFSSGSRSLVIRLKQFASPKAGVEQEAWTVSGEGAILQVEGYANVDFSVEIPDADKAWVHCDNIETKKYNSIDYSYVTIVLRIDANHTGISRSSELGLKTPYGVTGHIVVSQQ